MAVRVKRAIFIRREITTTILVIVSSVSTGDESVALADPLHNIKALRQNARTDRPDGGELILSKCTDCHSLRQVFQRRYDRKTWSDSLDRMADEGLELEPDEQDAIIEFLLSQNQESGWLKRVGEAHFAINHFPIAIIFVLALLEGLGWAHLANRNSASIRLMVWLAAVSAMLAVGLGFVLIMQRSAMSSTIIWHRNCGIGTAVIMLSVLTCYEVELRRRSTRSRLAYQSFLFLGVAAVSMAGYSGGSLVH